MARHPFTAIQFSVLRAAFYGDGTNADVGSRRIRTRTINTLTAEKLLYGVNIDGRVELTPAGLRAYVDMCERHDAASGCIAYQQRAEEARARLAAVNGEEPYGYRCNACKQHVPGDADECPHCGAIWPSEERVK